MQVHVPSVLMWLQPHKLAPKLSSTYMYDYGGKDWTPLILCRKVSPIAADFADSTRTCMYYKFGRSELHVHIRSKLYVHTCRYTVYSYNVNDCSTLTLAEEWSNLWINCLDNRLSTK